MIDKNLDIELIERFHEQKLTMEEQVTFSQRLLEDEEFAKSVKLQLNIVEEIDIYWTNNMVEKIEEWEKAAQETNIVTPMITPPIIPIKDKEPVEEPIVEATKEVAEETVENKNVVAIDTEVVETKSRKKWIWLLIILVVFLISGIGGLFYFSNNEEPNLFAENFENYPDIISSTITEDDHYFLGLGLSAYREKDYVVAGHLLRRYLNEVDEIEVSDSNAAVFYIALSNIGAGNANTAIKQLKEIRVDNNTIFQKPADWYLALGYLRFNDIEGTKQQLKVIIKDTKHEYNAKAKELLKQFEE